VEMPQSLIEFLLELTSSSKVIKFQTQICGESRVRSSGAHRGVPMLVSTACLAASSWTFSLMEEEGQQRLRDLLALHSVPEKLF